MSAEEEMPGDSNNNTRGDGVAAVVIATEAKVTVEEANLDESVETVQEDLSEVEEIDIEGPRRREPDSAEIFPASHESVIDSIMETLRMRLRTVDCSGGFWAAFETFMNLELTQDEYHQLASQLSSYPLQEVSVPRSIVADWERYLRGCYGKCFS